MNKYKVGQILKSKFSEDKYEIIEVFTRSIVLKNSSKSVFVEMIDTLDEHYTIIKDIAWKPEDGERYLYISDWGDVLGDIFGVGYEDKFRLATKNVFRTKEEAEARLSEIKKQYNLE